jgi:hypothetical protein
MRTEDKQYFTALSDWQLMGLCIEREAGGEPREGKIAVGTVILERVEHRNWDGKTVHEVILKPWQFSWTMPEINKPYYNEAVSMARNWREFSADKTLSDCCDIAKGLLDGSISVDEDLRKVNCVQYLNPKVAAATKDKWIKSG